MGGGQLDSAPIVKNDNIGGLLWGGYPGQEGGAALLDVLFGNVAPAGRLPTTQYPSDYISKVAMTDMSLRAGSNSPGRTYRWYEGTPVFEFGSGIHYTSFSASIQDTTASGEKLKRQGKSNTQISKPFETKQLVESCDRTLFKHLDLCPFQSFKVDIHNTGDTKSDYVALGFLTGDFGPDPKPKKSLVSYQRLHDIEPGHTAVAQFNLTLASISRIDEKGNTVVYPGRYSLLIDLEPKAYVNFTIRGEPVVLDEWPQPPAPPKLTKSGYFAFDHGGHGSVASQPRPDEKVADTNGQVYDEL
ncbi:hypothetical protein ACHAPT_010866 [Fusarium lateritium]